MTTVTAPGLRALTDHELSQAWSAGLVDVPTVEAECKRRDAADRASARQAAERAAWLDAAHADYLRADRDCAGRLFSRAGMAAGIPDALSLWRGSEAWARRMASEELNGWWDAHGRLSLAEYKRQQGMQRRAYRDERDLAAMPAPEVPERTAPAMRAPSARELAEQAAAAPRTAARPPGSIARSITALRLYRRELEATARVLARVNGGIQR